MELCEVSSNEQESSKGQHASYDIRVWGPSRFSFQLYPLLKKENISFTFYENLGKICWQWQGRSLDGMALRSVGVGMFIPFNFWKWVPQVPDIFKKWIPTQFCGSVSEEFWSHLLHSFFYRITTSSNWRNALIPSKQFNNLRFVVFFYFWDMCDKSCTSFDISNSWMYSHGKMKSIGQLPDT